VRVRPPNRADPDEAQVVVEADPLAPNTVRVDDGRRGRNFAFDHVFTGGQAEVFETMGRPMVEEALKGFNVCLFAYGQTGSGKTHSIQGGEGPDAEGLVPRFVREMFRAAQARVDADADLTVKVTMSYLEVYMERVRDLLAPRARGQEPESLELHEVNRRVVAKGASVHSVLGPERAQELMAVGNANRQTAETRMNEVSSRSHSIVQFTVSQLHEAVDRRDTECTVTLVDLAGSERQGKTESSGVQLEEAKKINQSLLVLGRALNSFSDGRGDMVSLRDSKLTRLLSDCFGGNAKTWMLATVSPTAFNVTESLSTLDYATHAKNITNRVTVNARERQKALAELRATVAQLNVAVDLERDEVDELRTVALSLENENAQLEALVVNGADDGDTHGAMLVAREHAVADQLERLLQSLDAPPASAAADASFRSPGGTTRRRHVRLRGGFSLAPVFDEPTATLTVKLDGGSECDLSGPVTATVQLSRTTDDGDSGSDDGIDAPDAAVRWCAHIRSVTVPADFGGRRVSVALLYALDLDCAYESEVLVPACGPAAPPQTVTVDAAHRFYIPAAAGDEATQWCRENPVMVVEVSGCVPCHD